MKTRKYCNEIFLNRASYRFEQFEAFMRDAVSRNTRQLLLDVYCKVIVINKFDAI